MRKMMWPGVVIAMTGMLLSGQAPATAPAMKLVLSAAAAPATKATNLSRIGKMQAVDLTTAMGDKLILAVDGEAHLPAWVSWVGPDGNLGDVTFKTTFVGYQIEHGLQVPSGFNTTMD